MDTSDLGSQRLDLPPKPFDVLVYLLERQGQIVSKQALLDAVWGGRRAENTVEQAVRQIRRALGDDRADPTFIRTIAGEGYCFIGPVNPEEAPRAQGRRPWRHAVSAALILALLAVGLELRPALPDPRLVNPVQVTRSRAGILSPILSDGTRLYYQQFDRGAYRVAQVAKSGGQSEPIPTDVLNPELCDVAPDGSSLLLRSLLHSRDDNEPVFIQPLVGGPARPLSDVLAYDAAWEPNGRYIVFTRDGALFRIAAEGGTPKLLFKVPGNAYWLRWSPDGRRMRLTVMDARTQALSLWETSVDGRTADRLFPHWTDQQCCGSWTPDGNYYVFQVRTWNNYQIWARSEKPSLFYRAHEDPVPLTLGPYNYRGPLPAANAKLFARTEVMRGEMVRFDRHLNRFSRILPGVPVRTAAFSPDGGKVAVTSIADNNLWRCEPDGTSCIPLTSGFQQTVMASWSPDGARIAFMAHMAGAKWSIYIVPADGGPAQLLLLDGRSDAEPSWSPDGTKIAFCHWLEPASDSTIYLTSFTDHRVLPVAGSAGMFSPRWSPDGKRIVAQRGDTAHLEIFDFGSGQWRILTHVPARFPNWSRDGRYVYFLSVEGARRTIRRVRVQDGAVEDVASLAQVEQGPFYLSDWVGLAPDDSPLAVRNLTTEDIYAWDFRAK